ncbi:transmembrane 220 family protein [Flavicella sediminum]|uniref:transmembrane 220 family protein n=1 Tax=Flavicella sediminum TaxID=2585141 RepID=UPI00111F48CE|nr:transmembrane 220 family protein [Flavicella sediminum]
MAYVERENKTRRITNLILGALFALFALVQLNDPDPIQWVLLYGVVAVISFVANYTTIPKLLIWILFIAYLIYAGTYLSYFLDWLDIDKKTELFGKMVYEKPYLEGTREFLGLLIAAAGLLYQLKEKTKR